MAKLRTNSARKSKNNSIVKLKIVVEKLQKSLSLGKRLSSLSSSSSSLSSYNYHEQYCEDFNNKYYSVPDDVKEGHFAVVATMEGEQTKRFVVPLSYLAHPTFLRLLERAAEEYGFNHEGALTVPCEPSELERILSC